MKKVIWFMLFALLLCSLATAGSYEIKEVSLPGFSTEDVSVSMNESHINFETSYLNKTIELIDFFVPDELQDDLSYVTPCDTNNGFVCQGNETDPIFGYDKLFHVKTDPNAGEERFYVLTDFIFTYAQYDSDGDIPTGFNWKRINQEVSMGYNQNNKDGEVFTDWDSSDINYSVYSEEENVTIQYDFINNGEVVDTFYRTLEGEKNSSGSEESIREVVFKGVGSNITATLDSDTAEGIVEFVKDDKFGANYTDTGEIHNFTYTFQSTKPLYGKSLNRYYFGEYFVNVGDICVPEYRNETNTTFYPNCTYSTNVLSTTEEVEFDGEVYNQTSKLYELQIDFVDDDGFIDPSYDLVVDLSKNASFNNTLYSGNWSYLDLNESSIYANLVGYWSADVDDDVAYDLAGDNDGSFEGHAHTSDGLYDKSYVLDGVSDYIEITPSDSLNAIGTGTGSEFTILTWAKHDGSAPDSFTTILNLGTTSTFIGLDHYTGTNGYRFVVKDSTNFQVAQYASSLITDEWNHFSARVENDTLEIYVDGVKGGTTDTLVGSDTSPDGELWRIGTQSTTSREWVGQIDEVMIFNTSLTEQQIIDIYNNQSARFKDSGTVAVKAQDIDMENFYNRINLTVNDYRDELGSSLSARIGYWDASKGYLDNYLALDGSGDSVSLSSDSNYDLTNSFTLAFRVKRGDGTSGGIFDNFEFNSPAFTGWSIGFESTGNIAIDYSNGGSTDGGVVATGVAQDVWADVVIVMDSSNDWNVYVDGSLSGTYSAPSAVGYPIGSPSTTSIGTSTQDGDFKGNIDDLRVYSREWSTSEISAFSNGTAIDSTGLVGSYNFDENVTDQSGNGNDGTLQGDAHIASPEEGLVGYWNFDDNYNDYSGQENHGTAQGDTYINESGVWNNSVFFDGNGDYIEIADDDSLDVGDDSITVSAWVYINSITTRYDAINKKQAGASSSGWASAIGNSGHLSYAIGDGSTNLFDNDLGSTQLSLQTWQHAVWVFEHGSDVKVYLNGELDGSESISSISGNIDTIQPVKIGARLDAVGSNENFFNGSIDEVMIYNRSLSADEIKQLYIKGKANFEYTDYQTFERNGATNASLPLEFIADNTTTKLLPEFKHEGGFYTSFLNFDEFVTVNYFSNFSGITLTNPPDGAYLNNIQTINWTVQGSADAINITLNNSEVDYITDGSTSYELNTSNFADGNYTLTVEAISGLSELNDSIEIVIDNTAPNGGYVFPSNGAKEEGYQIKVNISATDNFEVKNASFYIYDESDVLLASYNRTFEEGLFVEYLAESYGNYKYNATIYDMAGNRFNMPTQDTVLVHNVGGGGGSGIIITEGDDQEINETNETKEKVNVTVIEKYISEGFPYRDAFIYLSEKRNDLEEYLIRSTDPDVPMIKNWMFYLAVFVGMLFFVSKQEDMHIITKMLLCTSISVLVPTALIYIFKIVVGLFL